MSTKIFCDGCEKDLSKWGPELTITRAETSGGYGMPSGTSHLCADCGKTAFAVLRKAGEARS